MSVEEISYGPVSGPIAATGPVKKIMPGDPIVLIDNLFTL